jgi:trehalose/maltose hydrolase-like predicted phosphorylase
MSAPPQRTVVETGPFHAERSTMVASPGVARTNRGGVARADPPLRPVRARPAAPHRVPSWVGGTTFAAVLVPWSAASDPARLWPRIGALRDHGVDVALVSERGSPPVRPGAGSPAGPGAGRLLTCSPGFPEVAALLGDLDDQGIGARLVLGFRGAGRRWCRWEETRRAVAGQITLPPPEAPLLGVLDAELERHAQARLPILDEDPGWTLVITADDPRLKRVRETLLSLGDGRFGTRGTSEEDGAGSEPLVAAAGVFTIEEAMPRLLGCPAWTGLSVTGPASAAHRWVLDLRGGLLLHEAEALRTVRFHALARPGTVTLRAEGRPDRVDAGPSLQEPGDVVDLDVPDVLVRRVGGASGGVAAAGRSTVRTDGSMRTVERIAAYAADPSGPPEVEAAVTALAEAGRLGFGRLLTEQRRAWAQRWRHADVRIDGDPDLERAVRFALFTLMASVADDREAAVGARGLSGPAYAGHVFWDSDVFVLPFLAATHPTAARAMLEYRINRLGAARRRARDRGRQGAWFPWESAADGTDVTPRTHVRLDGAPIPVLTGEHEEHIVADVAWAAWHYAAWTGDRTFLEGRGAPLLIDTARYWASRVHLDRGGRGHIDDVIGPDEYHERVDDNAYTNVMARWNLQRAVDVAERSNPRSASPSEVATWRRLGDALVDGYDPDSGRYEQFAGFFGLDEVLITKLATPPVAADVLLDRATLQASQVIKQADVLMLHHLVPEATVPGSLAPNLAFYLPRTAHGSSLSPAVHAALLARCGDHAPALELLRLAARLDLDDLTGTTAGGLHLATMGGLWQALAWGFLGLRPGRGVLHLQPSLPAAWTALEINVRFRGTPVRIRAEPDHVVIHAQGPVVLRIDSGPPLTVSGRGTFPTGEEAADEPRARRP